MYVPLPPTESQAEKLHEIVTHSQVKQRQAANMQVFATGASTSKAPGVRASAGGRASAGRAMPK